jgi:hypothetical protein
VYYKDDWPQARERFAAFWHREIVDRCCVGVTAPRRSAGRAGAPAPLEGTDLLAWWMDPEVTLKHQEEVFASTFYGGEAFPVTAINLGASIMAAFFGSPPEFHTDTVWYPGIIQDWSVDTLRFDPARNPYYRMVIENTRYYVQQSQGRFFVGHAELGTAMDVLSLLRGMQNLCLDMLDRPGAVQSALALLADTWVQVHDEIYHITRDCNDGGCCLTWMMTWAPAPHAQIACDFSAIMSPGMFSRFTLPELQRYLAWNEYATYHWDGPDAIKHLDAVLTLEGIKAIQWTPGAGQERTSSHRWLPHYKRIQAAGKCLYLLADIDEVEILLRELSSRGLYIRTYAGSQEEACDLLRQVARWTRD